MPFFKDFRLEPAEITALDNPECVLQTGFWGRFKSAFGWQARAFRVFPLFTGGERNEDAGADASAGLLVLLRPLGAGFFLAYIPMGPPEELAAPGDWETLGILAGRLKAFLPAKTIFIRFDPPWSCPVQEQLEARRHPAKGKTDAAGDPPPERPFFRAAMDIQPPSTVILDLRPDEDAILAQMKKKNRYNINLAFKKGVLVREAGIEELPRWYEIYRETSLRDKIALHEYAYYQKLFELARENDAPWPKIKLFLADIDGTPEAGIIVCLQNRMATYLYGASSGNKRNYMPAYALQWRAIQEAKAAGCESYDLYGIPPTEDPEHPMAGLYRFKTGFGGSLIHRPGSWDYPLRPVFYRAYRLAEALRNWYFRKFKKR